MEFENKQEFIQDVINLAKQHAMAGNLEPYNELRYCYEAISDEDKQNLTEFVTSINN